METLRSSRKLYGAFSFPFKWAHWLGLDNMGMVILWFMLPTFIAALIFLPFLHPVPQTITFFFSVTMSLFSLLSSCILVVLLLPASFLGGRSDLRPLLNDNQKKKSSLKRCSYSTAVLSNHEAAWGKLWEALPPVLCLWELPSCATLQGRWEHICPLECQEPNQDGGSHLCYHSPDPVPATRASLGMGKFGSGF